VGGKKRGSPASGGEKRGVTPEKEKGEGEVLVETVISSRGADDEDGPGTARSLEGKASWA